MKNLFKISLVIFIFVLNCYSLNSTVFAEVDSEGVEQISADESIKVRYEGRIDGPDIPDYVKKFANDNGCFELLKYYYWSHKIYRDNGGIYSCGKNGKAQYIYEKNSNNMRFARWYEKRKFTRAIYEF